MTYSSKHLWIITDHNGQIIYHTRDRSHLDLMKKYVLNSQEAGEDWVLTQYSADEIIQCKRTDLNAKAG